MGDTLEKENRACPRSSTESSKSQESGRIEILITKLVRFYSAVGNRPEEAGALALMAEFLTQNATDPQIDIALSRCARECRYPVRLPDILQRLPGSEVPQSEAEARKAFDVVMDFARKYVANDVYGNFGPEHGWYPKSHPKLSDRILDTVRRTGGWEPYKRMTDRDFPFVQKRFFEAYAAWTAVEQVEVGRFLTQISPLQLVTKPIGPPEVTMEPILAGRLATVKKMSEPLTEAQRHDRREMLRQQAATMANRKTATLELRLRKDSA